MDDARRLDLLCINTIRTLAMDAIQKANSGHPGAPMGMAPVAYVLADRFLRFNPANPDFPNRDRFVLSMGHASMLLYSMLHLTGYDLTMEDLKEFRQLHAKCAGHPEFGLVPGVETTTGPLGQGVGNSVGMAIAGTWLAQHFNRPGHELFDYRVFALCSDGDLMEGVASEAASLAGHLALGNLIWVYDCNGITIDGRTRLTFTEDVGRRFEAYGWHVEQVADADDLDALTRAIEGAVATADRPSLVVVRSHIGYGSPNKQDTPAAHGSPLGVDEVRATKAVYGWDPGLDFHVSQEVTGHMRDRSVEKGRRLEEEWGGRFEAYRQEHPDLAARWELMAARDLPPGWDADLPTFPPDGKGLATRKAGGKVLTAMAAKVPWLFGGSADLAASNNTLVGDKSAFGPGAYDGRNLYFGIREHAMAAIASGLSLSGLRPYTATFLVFSDYMRPSIRLAAMMGQPVIYVFTHDSLGVGEDGPTHQPVEQLAALRAIPHLDVVRPADANETACAWRYALETTDHPVALVLTRQSVPTLDRAALAPAEGLLRGAYVLADCAGRPEVILIGTGSEVQLCLGARAKLAGEGVAVRVVSMPCQETFDRQDEEYRRQVLPPEVGGRVAVEAGVAMGWRRFVGPDGAIVSCDDFGTSAPGPEAMADRGITVESVVAAARGAMARAAR
ncbi:MAG TPA: transketolase [Phycisphaerae bacterium]|nr:transketolase [Phycisphaerae bacterium]